MLDRCDLGTWLAVGLCARVFAEGQTPPLPPGRRLTAGREPRPRVVYLITSSGGWWGGAERQVRYLAETFRRRGWDVGIVSMLPSERSLAELDGGRIRTATLDMTQGVPDPRAVLKLRSLLSEWRPDVLHAHMVHANLLARLSRLVIRTPAVISTIHNEDEGPQWRYLAYRMTDPLTDLTTAVSHRALEEAVRRGAAAKSRIVLVANGIRTEEYRDTGEARSETRDALGLHGEFVWLAVGRLIEAKAYPNLICAFANARAEHPAARLLIAGIGPLEEIIRTKVKEAGVEQSVELLGLRSDIPALMQAADGFVMSSAWEGLPMVLLEAGASSLPIVATDVGGSREAVLDGVSAMLVRPGDTDALGDAMRRVMALPAVERMAMGSAGRDHVSRGFDLERVADTWEELYREALRD